MYHSSPSSRPEFLKEMNKDFGTTVCEYIVKNIADSVMFSHDMYPVGYIQMFFQSQKLTSSGTTPPLGYQRSVKITGVPRGASAETVAKALSSYMNNSEDDFTVTSTGNDVRYTHNIPWNVTNSRDESTGFTVSTLQNGDDDPEVSEITKVLTVADTSAKAVYTGIPSGQNYSTEIRANDYGDKGNIITITGDSSKSLAQLVSEWNTVNPTNTAAVARGHTIVIGSGDVITLVGGDDGLDGKHFVLYEDDGDENTNGTTVAVYFDMTGNVPTPNDKIWTLCDGHIINDPDSVLNGFAAPDLMGKFLKHTIQDTIGGQQSFSWRHNHTGWTGYRIPPYAPDLQFWPFKRPVAVSHRHSIGTSGGYSEQLIPPYAEFQPYMRYK